MSRSSVAKPESEDLLPPGILDSLREPTPPARLDDTWPVTVARLANGRVQWVDLLSASAVAGPPGGFASILALRTPNSPIESPSCSCLVDTLSFSPTALLHHPLPYHKGSPPLTPTHRLSLPPRATKQTYQVAFCSPACLRPTPEEPISRQTHTSLFPQDAFASARRRHVRRGPGLPL